MDRTQYVCIVVLVYFAVIHRYIGDVLFKKTTKLMVKNGGFYWSSEQRGVFEMERKKGREKDGKSTRKVVCMLF